MRRLLILVAALALLTAACKIEINAHFTINADRSGSVTLEIGLDDEVLQLAEAGGGSAEDLFADMDIDIEDVPGAETSTERRGDMTFYIVTMPIDDITQAEGLGDQAGLEGLGEDFQITFTEDRVTVEGSTAIDDALGGAEGELGGMSPEMLASFFEVNLRITMPGKVLDHNADSLDGSTLTWNVDLAGDGLEIYAQSDPNASPGGGMPLWLWIAIGAGALVLLALLFTAMKRRGSTPAAPPAPAGDAPPPPPPAE